jgi:hypothetical protein
VGTASAYDPGFRGGVRVAVGDVNGDGRDDIVTGAGAGGGPHVQVFSGRDFSLYSTYFAYAPNFTNGIYVAVGDVDGDGLADVITGAGSGGGPHIQVFSLVTNRSYYAYAPEFTGGVRVAARDLNGDGRSEVITGPGPGGSPHIRVFRDGGPQELFSVFAFDPGFLGGTFVG